MPKTLIIFFIFLVIIGLGYTTLWPSYQKLESLQGLLEERKAELKNLEEYFSSLEKNLQNIKEYPDSLAIIDTALPSEPSVPSLFMFLQRKASENGLILRNIGQFSIAPKEEGKKLKEINITAELAGSYSSLKNFFSALEKTERIIDLEEFSLTSPTEKTPVGSEPIFNFNLKLKTYSY
jgi:Tfp pilus assembly protein PilO